MRTLRLRGKLPVWSGFGAPAMTWIKMVATGGVAASVPDLIQVVEMVRRGAYK